MRTKVQPTWEELRKERELFLARRALEKGKRRIVWSNEDYPPYGQEYYDGGD